MAEFNEVANAERIAKLNAGAAKSDLPYHTDETEKIQAERAKPHVEPVKAPAAPVAPVAPAVPPVAPTV